MDTNLKCPNCNKVLKTTAVAAGKSIKCPACHSVFKAPDDNDVVGKPGAESLLERKTPLEIKKSRHDDHEDDRRDRRRAGRDDDDEDEDRPRSNKRASRDDEDDEDEVRPRSKKRASRDDDDEDEDRPRSKRRASRDDDDDEDEDRPRSKRRASRDDDDDEDEDRPRNKRRASRDDEDDENDNRSPSGRGSRSRGDSNVPLMVASGGGGLLLILIMTAFVWPAFLRAPDVADKKVDDVKEAAKKDGKGKGGQELVNIKDTGKCFLWAVTSPTTTVYLLGSMTHATTNLFPLPVDMENAYANSTAVVVHADGENDALQLKQLVGEIGIYPAGQSLSQNLSKKTLEALRRYAKKKGAKVNDMDSVRPWLLAVQIQEMERQILSRNIQPLQSYFVGRARGQKKPIHEIEKVEDGLRFVGTLAPDLQEMFLDEVLLELDALKPRMERRTAAWKMGDVEAMDAVNREDQRAAAEENKKLELAFDTWKAVTLQRMVSKIDDLLKGKDQVLVIVQAEFLVGDKGLVKLLANRNFRVEQVTRGTLKRN